MRLWVILLRVKSRTEYPTIFLFEGTSDEGNEIEQQIRSLFERGLIKDFAVQPIRGPESYSFMIEHLMRLEDGE